MKRVLLWSVVLSAAFAANAAYTPVEWIKASGTQWINTKYTPKCTDKIEMKVNFATKDGTQCLYCSRGTTTATGTFTSFLLSSKIRVDRNNAAGASVDLTIAANTDYVLTVDYNARKATLTDGTTTKELTNLTDGTYTPGSPLALFASHTSGTGLTDETSMDNWGSYKLAYVKIYDKDGKLVRNFVPVKDESSSEPRCQAGLYETVTRRFCPANCTGTSKTALTCGNATGAADYEAIGGDDEYVLTVAQDQVLTLTADHVAAAAGKTFVKSGKGTLYVAGDTMKDFPGDIRVRDGYYVAQSKNALGTAAGLTFVEPGGTLVNEVANDKNDGSACPFRNEIIHLKGEGCGGWGALQNKKKCVDFCRNIFLDGPARVVTNTRFDWRSTSTEMNWYPLEVNAHGGGFYFVNETFSHMGDVTCTKGLLEFQAGVSGCLASSTVTMKTGSQLSVWGVSVWLSCKFVLEDGVGLESTYGAFKYADTDNRNVLSGPVTFGGSAVNDVSKGVQYQFRGKLTGEGGITPGTNRGGYLQFIGQSANDFKGGVAAQGLVENDQIVGGIVTYKNGAIPAGETAGPITLDTAKLEVRTIDAIDLPALAVTNAGEFVHDGKLATCNVKSLEKTGTGVFSVNGPFHVKGKTDIKGGTLRLASQVPSAVPGLFEAGNTSGNPNPDLKTEAQITASSEFKGVCLTGMQYAYTGWSGGKGYYDYVGNFKVPGEEGTSVRCRFSSCIYRYVKLWIDGTLVLQISDDKVNTPSNAPSIGWTRHYWSDPITLTAGWHSIAVYMQGTYGTDNGPSKVTGDNATKYGAWPEKFGLGVDFNATETLAKNAKDSDGMFVDSTVTDSTRYTKFTDPGDGSFLVATFDASKRTTYIADSESKFRATFAGDVAFAPGAVFDIGDVEPYWPVTVPSLTGLPTVRNGALNVTSSTWTLRLGDLTGSTPLTVGANASVTFPATVTITGDASMLAYGKTIKARPLIAVEPGGTLGATTFTLSSNLKTAGYRLTVEDGVPVLSRERGLMVLLR